MLPTNSVILVNTLRPYLIYNRIIGLIPFGFVWRGTALYFENDVYGTLAKLIYINGSFYFNYVNTLKAHLKEFSVIESVLQSWISLTTILVTDVLILTPWFCKHKIKKVFYKIMVTDIDVGYNFGNKWIHAVLMFHVLKCSVLCAGYVKEAGTHWYFVITSVSLMLCLFIESSAHLLYAIPIVVLSRRFALLNANLTSIQYGKKCGKEVIDVLRNVKKNHAELVSVVHEFTSCFQLHVCMRLTMLFLTTIFMLFNIYKTVFVDANTHNVWTFAYATAFDFSEIVGLGISGRLFSQQVKRFFSRLLRPSLGFF